MTEQLDAMRAGIVAAVQQELDRFSQQVSAEMQRLRDELAAERAARARSEEIVRSVLPAIEERLAEFSTQTKRRQDEMDHRIGRMADETNLGLAAAVESAARPVVKQLEHRQDQLEQSIGVLDRGLRKFDAQTGALVQQFNATNEATAARIDEIAAQVVTEFDGRVAMLSTRLDDVSAQAARQQAEVSNIVGVRVDQAEDRINDRIIAVETRLGDTIGQQVADIDAYVGRVSLGLDDSVAMLNDRIAGAEARFGEVDLAIDVMATRLAGVDVEALDEMKDRVASAAGEVELVRIEMDRFQSSISESIDRTVGRIVDLETQLQEQHMDVETAVQLERLEEVERALIALDPAQFVRRGEVVPTGAPSIPAPPSGFSAPGPDGPRAPSPMSPTNPLTPPAAFEPHVTAQH